jgi:CRP-like cAMP-binding protein
MLFDKNNNFRVEDYIKLEDDILPKDDNHDTESVGEPDHRSLKPAWFSSYHTLAPSELLLVSNEYFSTFLMDAAISDLKKRYEVVHACGTFNQWPNLEKLRLARMGFVKSFKTGDVIIEQGRKNDYLYFIMTGMCKVKKRADKTEIVGKLLAEAKQKALNHDTKYAFHHRLRQQLAPVTKDDLIAKNRTVKPEVVDTSGNISEPQLVNLSQELLDTEYLTLSEVQRAHLTEEIARLEILLTKEEAIKAKEEQEYETAMEDYLKNPQKVGSKLPKRSQTDCDICVLNWPRFFGEICLFEPDHSICLGTVVAESACDLLMVHKYQLQTFHIGESLLDRVSDRSVKFPSDQNLILKIDKEKDWSKYRTSLMHAIPKSRWPTQEIEYEQMVFSNQHTYI